jgi:hypothetical protein
MFRRVLDALHHRRTGQGGCKALLQMNKLDIAELQRAFKGKTAASRR